MGTIIAFTIGYVLGSKGGRERYDEVASSIRDIRSSEEFGGMVLAVSSHLEHIVQEAGTRLTSPEAPPAEVTPDPAGSSAPAWAADWMDGANGQRAEAGTARAW